ncbi:hypothetical protein CFAM422_007253 [Trichoderma lentiforme]|uniref:Uncharacterized protein n=1 Tax=Trichoderma lentiforme TaxID=1567552 RepID=A0A9P4XDW1_9HYPO|nr:hypothetical protein CFAM422_007253 [Trichoderma lentiforme]
MASQGPIVRRQKSMITSDVVKIKPRTGNMIILPSRYTSMILHTPACPGTSVPEQWRYFRIRHYVLGNAKFSNSYTV